MRFEIQSTLKPNETASVSERGFIVDNGPMFQSSSVTRRWQLARAISREIVEIIYGHDQEYSIGQTYGEISNINWNFMIF